MKYKVGDKVIHLTEPSNGIGEVIEINEGSNHPVYVSWEKTGGVRTYKHDGTQLFGTVYIRKATKLDLALL